MEQMHSVIKQLVHDFPSITFEQGELFSWSPTRQTVTYQPSAVNAPAQLLHEVGHALLGHTAYLKDVELVAMEADAWEKARALAVKYDITIDDTTTEDHLDTYREWLYRRSLCPQCGATGLQRAHQQYFCVACTHSWRVNEARVCALRRYAVK